MSPKEIKDILEEFERAVREHAFIGSQLEWETRYIIEHEYQEAKKSICQVLGVFFEIQQPTKNTLDLDI